MDFAADFTAIDFETANRRPESACQLGAVVVRQGRITESAMWMIRPKPLYFSRTNIQIHGITPEQVRDEKGFGELWPEIAERLADDCLVAHNAPFDMGVLIACLRAHDLAIPDLQFLCTRKIARRTWPNRPRYGLKPLSDWLGVRFQHHDALEDSIACAKVLLAAGMDSEAKDLPDLERKLRIGRGTANQSGQRNSGRPPGRVRKGPTPSSEAPSALPFHWPGDFPSTGSHRRAPTNPSAPPTLDLQRLMIRAEFIRPLSGRRVVFTGRLRCLSREDAESLAARLGGSCQESVTETTDFVVVGSPDQRTKTAGRSLSVKEEAAQQLQASGKAIQILNEDEFLGLIVASKG